MDRKSLIILVVAVLVLIGSQTLVDRFFPPQPVPPDQLAAMTNQPPGATNLSTAETTVPGAQTITAAPASAPTQPATPEQTLTVSNQDVIYHFTSHGGGIQTIELRKYPATIVGRRTTNTQTTLASLNTKAPIPVLDLLSKDSLGDGDFALTENAGIVRAERTLTNGLRIVKEFTMGTNYRFTANIRFENTTDKPIRLPERELVIGTATPMGPTDDPTTLGAFWYNGTKAEDIKEAWFANRTLIFFHGIVRTDYAEGASNVVWAAVHNQYFTLAAIPATPAYGVRIHKISIPPPDAQMVATNTAQFLTNGYETTLTYSAAMLPARQTLEQSCTFYAGPKEYNRLAQIGQKMNNNLDLIMGFSGFFGFFSKLLLLSMTGLHAIGLTYGFAVVAITVIIKVVFWPLTNAAMRSQKRLQVLQPQIKAIADKYKDDALKKHQKTTEFMKEHKVSPMGSCLPTLLQIPVFFGFYWMLRNAIELRGVPFLWANDLSQPDTIGYIGGIPLNPLPLIYGAAAIWQAHLTPPAPGMDPTQQKIMRYMPLMFIAIFYKMSAGLTLYWTVQTTLSIVQTKMTKAADPIVTGSPAPLDYGPPKKKK